MSRCLVFCLRLRYSRRLRQNTRRYGYRGLKIFTSLALRFQDFQRRLGGTNHLIASLLYVTGMRIMECLRLRVQDVDFTRREILIRDGKGAKDRVTMLPDVLAPVLRTHLDKT